MKAFSIWKRLGDPNDSWYICNNLSSFAPLLKMEFLCGIYQSRNPGFSPAGDRNLRAKALYHIRRSSIVRSLEDMFLIFSFSSSEKDPT